MKRIPCGSNLNDRIVQLYRVHSALTEIHSLPPDAWTLEEDKRAVILNILQNLEDFLTCVGHELFPNDETKRVTDYNAAINQVRYALNAGGQAGLASLNSSLNRLYGQFDRLKRDIFKRRQHGNCENQYTGIRTSYNTVCVQ